MCTCVYVCVMRVCMHTVCRYICTDYITCGNWFNGTPSAGSSTCSTSSGIALMASGAMNVVALPVPVSGGKHCEIKQYVINILLLCMHRKPHSLTHHTTLHYTHTHICTL